MSKLTQEQKVTKAEQYRVFEVRRLQFCAIRAKEQEEEGLNISERQKYLIKNYL